MASSKNLTVVIGILLLIEVAREAYLLKLFGFQPSRFVEWLKSDEIVTKTEVCHG